MEEDEGEWEEEDEGDEEEAEEEDVEVEVAEEEDPAPPDAVRCWRASLRRLRMCDELPVEISSCTRHHTSSQPTIFWKLSARSVPTGFLNVMMVSLWRTYSISWSTKWSRMSDWSSSDTTRKRTRRPLIMEI